MPANKSSTASLSLRQVAERIQAVREYVGLSREAFAERLGYTRRQVLAWETAANTPPISLLAAMRQLFDIDPEWVLMGPGKDPVRSLENKDIERRERVIREVQDLVTAAGLRVSEKFTQELTS